MTWTPIQRSGNRREAFNRVTMACSQAGRHKAWSVRITIRSGPDWLTAGTKADVHIGSGDVAGLIRIMPGTEHNVRAMPTPGKAPTGVVFIQFGPWDGFTPTIQKPTECEYENAADGMIVSLPPWALPSGWAAPKEITAPNLITAPAEEITAPNRMDEPEEIAPLLGRCCTCNRDLTAETVWLRSPDNTRFWCSRACHNVGKATPTVDRSPPLSVSVAREAPAPTAATVPPPSPPPAPAPTPATPHAFLRLAQIDEAPAVSGGPRHVPLPESVSTETPPPAAMQVIRRSWPQIKAWALRDGVALQSARDLQKYNQRREAAGQPIFVLPPGSRIAT